MLAFFPFMWLLVVYVTNTTMPDNCHSRVALATESGVTADLGEHVTMSRWVDADDDS